MNSKEQAIVGLTSGSRMRRRRGVSIAAFVAISAMGGVASAQTVAFGQQPLIRDPEPNPARTLGNQWDINRQDCVDDGQFKYNLQFVLWSTQTFDVWATTQGADCSLLSERNNLMTPRCFKVAVDNLPVPGNMSATVTLNASDIIAATNPELAADCGASSEPQQAKDLRIFFLLLDGSSNPVSSVAWPRSGQPNENMRIDLWGAPAPTKVTVTPGDGSVSLSVPPSTDLESKEFVVYCAQNGQVIEPQASGDSEESSGCSWSIDATELTGGAGGSAGEGGTSGTGGSAGSAGAGGAGGGIAGMGGSSGAAGAGGGSACDNSPFVEGEVPSTSWVPCATTGSVENLENGASYSIAVAYRDIRGNIGELSEPQCITPAPMDDFFEAYNRSGGSGGGGFCSISPRTRRATSFGVSFALAALALVYRRRARQNRASAPQEVSK